MPSPALIGLEQCLGIEDARAQHSKSAQRLSTFSKVSKLKAHFAASIAMVCGAACVEQSSGVPTVIRNAQPVVSATQTYVLLEQVRRSVAGGSDNCIVVEEPPLEQGALEAVLAVPARPELYYGLPWGMDDTRFVRLHLVLGDGSERTSVVDIRLKNDSDDCESFSLHWTVA